MIQGKSIEQLSPSPSLSDTCDQFFTVADPFLLFHDLQPTNNAKQTSEMFTCLLERMQQKAPLASLQKNSFEVTRSISELDKRAAEQEVFDALQITEQVPVIIWLSGDGKSTHNTKRLFLDAVPFKVTQEGTAIPFVAGTIDNALFLKIQSLKKEGLVDFIAFDHPIRPALVESRSLLGVPVVENQLGFTGKGIGVCVLDSGIDYTHPALGACTLQQFLAGQCTTVVAGYDFCSTSSTYPFICFTTDPDPLDEAGHGTHVAGIVVSTDNQFRGVAPGAHLIAVRVLDKLGYGDVASLAAGIDWCVQNKDLYNIRVVTMSLRYIQGAYSIYTPQTCPVTANPAINKALAAGIFVAAASGNDGSAQGISYPACAPGVVSVGSTNDANLGTGVVVDQVSSFSNRHASLDLLAPGNIIDSTAPSQGFQCTSPSKSFVPCLGTSMATPHVAGSAAVIIERYPFFSGTQVESLLKQTGVPVFDSATQITFSRVDLLAALTPSGSQTPSLTLSGVPQREQNNPVSDKRLPQLQQRICTCICAVFFTTDHASRWQNDSADT